MHAPATRADLPHAANVGLAETADAGDINKPKRPLSAYNFFFKMERAEILKELPDVTAEKKPRRSHGKIGFKELATRISTKWKSLPPDVRYRFDQMAALDKKRYLSEKKQWKGAKKGTPTNAASIETSPDPLYQMAQLHAEFDLNSSASREIETHSEFEFNSSLSKEIALRRFSLFGSHQEAEATRHNQLQPIEEPIDCLVGSFKASDAALSGAMIQRRMSLWSLGFPAQEQPMIDPDASNIDSVSELVKQASRREMQLLVESKGLYQGQLLAPTIAAALPPTPCLAQLSSELDEECKTLLKNLFNH
jgi:HMG-box domain